MMPRTSSRPLKRVAIEQFPIQLHGWRASDSHVAYANVLPGSHMIERTYADQSGHSIDVLLITGTDADDFHDATVCLPLQGFDITPQKTVVLPGSSQTARELTAAKGANQLTILYWRPSAPTLGGGLNYTQWRRVEAALRQMQGNSGQSLMVRFTAPTGPNIHDLLLRTAAQWEPDLEALSRRHM